MGYAIYEARRELAPSHFAGTDYSLPLEVAEFVYKGGDLRHVAKAMAGNVEIQYLGTERIWHVVLAPVSERESALIREFLHSTADGQQFTFDPFGTESAPRKSLTVVRDDEGFTEAPFIRSGDPDGDDAVEFAFDVRQV